MNLQQLISEILRDFEKGDFNVGDGPNIHRGKISDALVSALEQTAEDFSPKKSFHDGDEDDGTITIGVDLSIEVAGATITISAPDVEMLAEALTLALNGVSRLQQNIH